MTVNSETRQSPPTTTPPLQAKILIVDDSYMVAEMLSNFLGKQGCTIAYALDGIAALEQIRDNTPDLIIADWVMPNLDGLGLCQQLRQSPEFSWIYYIMMTAREGNDNMERALEAGADEFLSKPFQAAELMTRVRTGLRIVELRRKSQPAPDQRSKPAVKSRQELVAQLPQRIASSRSQSVPLSLFILRLANLGALTQILSPSDRQSLLEQFSSRLVNNLRDGDDVFIYDEGQFIVILPGATLTAALIAAERSCTRMLKEPFLTGSKSTEALIQYGTSTLESSDDSHGMSLLRRAAQGMRDNRSQGGLTSTLTVTHTTDDQYLKDRLTVLEAENLELRLRASLVTKLESENQQLKHQIQQLTLQLKQAAS